MLAYVSHQTALDRPGEDGASRRDHLLVSARRGNAKAKAALRGPRFPQSLRYLWDWFREVSAARPMGMMGVSGLTFEGIQAWATLTDQHPEPHEVRAIFEIDAAFRAALQPPRDGPATTKGSDRPPEKPWPSRKRATEETA